MGDYRLDADMADAFNALQLRVEALEAQSRVSLIVSNTSRPAAAAVRGLIVFNTSTGKHEGSNGTVWSALY